MKHESRQAAFPVDEVEGRMWLSRQVLVKSRHTLSHTTRGGGGGRPQVLPQPDSPSLSPRAD